MEKIVTHPKKLEFINVEQIIAIEVRLRSYKTAIEKCKELLFIKDEDCNPNWRELTQKEEAELEKKEAELETFKSYMIVFNMTNGKKIKWKFETKDDVLLWIVQNLTIKKAHILKELEIC